MADTEECQDIWGMMMSLIQIPEKLGVMEVMFPKPEFKQDYDYVDYGLYVLREIVVTPFKVYPSLLEVSAYGQVKSAAKSASSRNIGNASYKDKNFNLAHRQYTRSISCAPIGSVELALAYGNRSAVLFQLKLFKECIEDIDRALASNYPKEKQLKLLDRQKKAKKLLPTQDKTPYHGPLPQIVNKNSIIPFASDHIKVKKNKRFGRHIVATKEINPGQVLLVEKPYANTVNNFGHLYLFCSECLELCYNLIPCEKCRLLYCSKVCRKKAFVDYHRYECAILRHFGIDFINWTAVRITLKGIKEYGITNINTYNGCSHLFTNEHSTNESETDILLKAIEAAKVFHVLKQYTDFFSEFDIDDNENVFKNMYLKNLKIESMSIEVQVNNFMNDDVTLIGRAIYPILSLYNHACNQNTLVFFYGSTVVVKATSSIKRGEQCFINYGTNPVTLLREQRQRYLEENYKFVCKCQACIENWPIVEVTITLQKGKLIEELIHIYNVIFSGTKIDDQYKKRLFQRSLQISEILKSEAPFLLYKYATPIFRKLLSDGNYIKPELFNQILKF